MRIPIIYDGDPWMELWFVEAEDRKAALIKEANRLVSERNSSPGKPPSRVDPKGVQGSCAPVKGIVIQTLGGDGEWKTDSALIAPEFDQGVELEEDDVTLVSARVSPKGMQGTATPIQSVTIQTLGGNGEWKDDIALTVPIYD